MKSTVCLFSLSLSLFLPLGAEQSAMQPTADQQKELTGDSVLKELMQGNARYVEGKPTRFDLTARIAKAAEGQYPKAYILSCVDSRVPVEQVFDQSIGDVFVGRVAGNIESAEQLGSIEFATKAAGAKLVMVLGHEACGAVKGACDHVKMGNLTGLLEQIQPAVEAVDGYEESERNSSNKKFVDEVTERNVAITVEDIRKRSEVLAALEKEGKIKIVGAMYSMKDGKVTLVD